MRTFSKISLRWRLTLLMAIILTAVNLVFALVSASAAKDIYSSNHDEKRIVAQGELHSIHPNFIIQKEQDGEFVSRNLVYVLLTILTGSAATYFISGYALKPVRNLSKEVNSIDENHLHFRVKLLQSNDEVAVLASCFNGLFERLEKAFTAQKNFSANAAHELRTPLAGIISSIEVLQMDETPDPDECKETLNDVLHSAERLSMLVEDLLEMNRELSMADCGCYSLQNIIDDIRLELESEIIKKSIEFVCHCGCTEVYGEKNLLHRALFNVIQNAIKYNLQAGKVIVSSQAKNGCTVISISDNGIGIPDAERERIFEPFYCVDKSRARELGGSGLGLSIVKLIVNKHKGTVQVERGQGNGSTFIISLPKLNRISMNGKSG